jgi:hypothetical protein
VIVIGVPTAGLVSIQWHNAMMALQTPAGQTLRHVYAHSHREIGDARNAIVAAALAEGATHILFIADDVLVPPTALAQLLAHKLPIVAGLYYAKTPHRQPMVIADVYAGRVADFTPGDLVPCAAHGMGCTLIARDVFEALPSPWFKTTMSQGMNQDGAPTVLHQTEDAYFLSAARALGFQPHVDTGVFCWHWSPVDQLAYPVDLWREAHA